MAVITEETFETSTVGQPYGSGGAPNVVVTEWANSGTKSLRYGHVAGGSVGPSGFDKSVSVAADNLTYWRGYFKVGALPAAGGSGVYLLAYPPYSLDGLFLTSSGIIYWGYTFSQTVALNPANPVVNGEIFRLEMRAGAAGYAGVGGPGEAKIFRGANKDGVTPDQTATHNNYSWASNTNAYIYSGWSQDSNPGHFYVDDIKLADDGWIGPAGAAPPATQQMGWGITRV